MFVIAWNPLSSIVVMTSQLIDSYLNICWNMWPEKVFTVISNLGSLGLVVVLIIQFDQTLVWRPHNSVPFPWTMVYLASVSEVCMVIGRSLFRDLFRKIVSAITENSITNTHVDYDLLLLLYLLGKLNVMEHFINVNSGLLVGYFFIPPSLVCCG